MMVEQELDTHYFAMLTTQRGTITPMMDGEELAIFISEDECADAARQTVLGAHFGFEVFAEGSGEIQ
jgi:hypothetical protein